MQRFLGFGLVELLIVIAIVAIVYLFAVPFMQQVQQRITTKTELAKLQQLLSVGRQYAIFHRTRVSLCPIVGQTCSSDWNLALMLFEDSNNNGQLDSNEKIIQIIEPVNSNRELRAFNSHHIGFNSQGFTGFATGSLSYCNKITQKYGGVFVISRSGRVRESRSTSSSWPTLANGTPAPCSA